MRGRPTKPWRKTFNKDLAEEKEITWKERLVINGERVLTDSRKEEKELRSKQASKLVSCSFVKSSCRELEQLMSSVSAAHRA